MATWIKAGHNGTHVQPANGKSFSLEELQHMVGGYIEALPLSGGRVMWLNEEGKLNGLPYNGVADLIAHKDSGVASWDQIVGDVVIASLEESGEDREERDLD